MVLIERKPQAHGVKPGVLLAISLKTFRILPEGKNGAQKRTRTSTPLRAPPPEDGASTNSAIWARTAQASKKALCSG